MIDEKFNNKVFFSDLLPKRCPKTFKGLSTVLDKYSVSYEFIHGAKDIWCRDFMPIQISRDNFAQFYYEPDYLLDTDEHRASITDSEIAGNYCGDSTMIDCRKIKLDGGNVIHSDGMVIMTAKIFEENPQFNARQLIDTLTEIFEAEIIFLPWDTNEIYGHSDGIIRFMEDDSVLLTNYGQFDPKMADRFRKMMEPHFSKVAELHFKARKPHKYSWAYINWLQTDKVLILPEFGIPEDEEAFTQISTLMPSYKGRIEMVDATDLLRLEGGLNCASWTILYN